MKNLFYPLLFVLTLIITNCKDDPKPEFFIDEDTKEYCVFNIGSWWIYEEEKGFHLDTQNLLINNNVTLESKNLSYKRKGFISKWQNSDDYYKGMNEIEIFNGPSRTEPKISYSSESFVIGPNLFEDITFISTKDTTFKFNPSGQYELKLLNAWDTIIIFNKKYNDVRCFDILNGSYSAYQKKVYWARNVGKIRIERADGTIWNLIDYNIKK